MGKLLGPDVARFLFKGEGKKQRESKKTHGSSVAPKLVWSRRASMSGF